MAGMSGFGRRTARREMRRAGFEACAKISGFELIGCRAGDQACGFDAYVGICEGVGDCLKLADRLPELFARARVLRGGADQRIACSHEIACECGAVERQRIRGAFEALAAFAVNPPPDFGADRVDALDFAPGMHAVDVFGVDLEKDCCQRPEGK